MAERATLQELEETGVWQEIHRCFLHPVGLELREQPDGNFAMLKIEDPAGGWLGTPPKRDLMNACMREVQKRTVARGKKYKRGVQPLDTPHPDTPKEL